jgi:hypothetical protein
MAVENRPPCRRPQHPAASPQQELIDAQVKALWKAGLLHETLIDPSQGSDKSLRRAYDRARQGVEQAALWGQWYGERRNRLRTTKSAHRQLAHESERLAAQLDGFLERCGWPLIENPVAALRDPLYHSSIIRDVCELAERLALLSKVYSEPPKIKTTGHPSNAWLLGFIWGMGSAWRQLTAANISSSGRFPRFLQAGFDSVLKPKDVPENPEWETLVKTAIRRFGMKRKKWLEPIAGVGGKKSSRIS